MWLRRAPIWGSARSLLWLLCSRAADSQEALPPEEPGGRAREEELSSSCADLRSKRHHPAEWPWSQASTCTVADSASRSRLFPDPDTASCSAAKCPREAHHRLVKLGVKDEAYLLPCFHVGLINIY